MKATQILVLSAASLMMLAGCSNKKGGEIPENTAGLVKEIFYKLPNESSPGELPPGERRKLFTLPRSKQLTFNGFSMNGMADDLEDDSNVLLANVWFGEDGFHFGWEMACYFTEDGKEVQVLVTQRFIDTPQFSTVYLHAFRYVIDSRELTPIDLPFEAFTEKELFDDSKLLGQNSIKSAHKIFKESPSGNKVYFVQPDGLNCQALGILADAPSLYDNFVFDEYGPFPIARRVWNGKEFVKATNTQTVNEKQDRFALTVMCEEISLGITAQKLLIDWGDGATGFYNPIEDDITGNHTYETEGTYTVTAIVKNITGLNFGSAAGPEYGAVFHITGLDVSGCPNLTQLDCSNNRMSAKALNALFNSLPTVKKAKGDAEPASINISGSTNGNREYNTSIAEKKGWIVIDRVDEDDLSAD
jgi:hypothetical protein